MDRITGLTLFLDSHEWTRITRIFLGRIFFHHEGHEEHEDFLDRITGFIRQLGVLDKLRSESKL